MKYKGIEIKKIQSDRYTKEYCYEVIIGYHIFHCISLNEAKSTIRMFK